ncbi:uncharacterized protein LOC130451874 [Diorhabda sublineata]|uniref:uncharacterized protein LOC130451874 n=1 Tax=Diorhabda sublineata TaxID=1163346 RepID=UPI0024E0A17C|nr:uncharacterized protein LOC130451874 [Diorhabda sublineata]
MMRVFCKFLGLVFLIARCIADYNPLENPNVCGVPTCKVNDDQRKFKYGPGNEQTYNYIVEVKSVFNGTSKNESSLFIQGKVILGFLTPCDGLLYLSDIKLSGHRPKNGEEITEHVNSMEFADALTTYSVRFAFQDGIIYEVCPKEEEKEWVLNFKKGILSMLQNSMKRFDLDYSVDEEDVRGKCPTHYKVFGVKETTLLIEKTKDLEMCQGRSKLHSSIQSQAVPIFQGSINKDNILKSKSRCTISIDRNIYKDIFCEESYLLQPFSNYEQGAITTVTQELTLQNEIPTITVDDEELMKRVPLTFNNVITAKPISDDIEISKDSMEQLCKLDKMSDRMQLADFFSKFIHSLRSLSYSALNDLYMQSGSVCPTAKQYLLYALPFVNTIGSVTMMKDIVVEKSVPESTIKDYISAIGSTSAPNNEMMDVAMSLLQETKFYLSALSVASLTHTYCNQHTDCRNENVVLSIMEFYENHFRELFQQQPFNRTTNDEIMVTLKALSNIGLMSDDFIQELVKVIENSEIDVGIRVAAVESFRRTSCDDTRSYFEHIFRTQEMDAEVRIAAYLQIMRCPDYLLIKTIRHTLMNEEVNQVGSFIWTHLNNLLRSAKPSKVGIQSLISDKDLSKKFDIDVRKFSRNFEGSMYFEEYNGGGNYESNVIFSTNSYVPKSAMLNLTVDLFGESFNVFEIYGRVDGFEHYLESIFGPKGSSQTIKENFMDTLKWRRDTSQNALIKNQVDELPNVVDNFATEPKVAFGYKIFGNEEKYMTFVGDKEIKDYLKNLDPVYNLAKILSGKEIIYNKSSMFLDGKYIVPSGAGLPISLAVTGTASVNIKLYGNLTSGGKSQNSGFNIDLTADVEPTVSVDLTGEMSVDAVYTSTGIKLKTNLYSDSALKADIKISGTKLVSLKLSLPREKNEIFVASSELLVKKDDIEETQEGLVDNRIKNEICSWPAVDEAIGLKLCTNYNFVNVTKITNLPYLLMIGPANFRISLHKADPTATVYLFQYKYESRENIGVISVIFDTPGSAVERLISANLTLDNQSQNMTLFLRSATNTVVAYGRYKFTPDEQLIQLEFDINNVKHFEASAGLKRSTLKHGYSYRPNVYVGVSGERIISFTGNVETMSKGAVSQYSVNLSFNTKRFKSILYGYILKGDTSVQGSLTNDYQFIGTKKHRISFKFGIGDKSHKKNMEIYAAFFSILSSAYPNMNLDANATFHRSDNHKDFSFKLYQSPLPKSNPNADDNTLKFEILASYSLLSDGRKKFQIETSVNRRSNNLELRGKLTYETYRYDITSVLLIQYGQNKEVSITIFWSHPRSSLEQIKTHVNVTIPSFTPMILRLQITEKQPKDYMIDFKGTWFSGHSMNAAVSYQDKSDPLSVDHHVKLLLMSPHFKDITIDLQFYRDNDILKFDLKGDIDKKQNYDYGISFFSQTISENSTKTGAQLKYGMKLYSYSGYIYDGDYKKISANIHLDQIRDIVFALYLCNQHNDKAIDFEINWDSNRNANQKVMVSATYKKQAAFDYTANFIVTYPGRGIKGDYSFLLDGKRLKTLVSLSWDVEKTFAIDLDVIYEYNQKLFFEIASELKTPFDNWKVTQLQGSLEHLDHMYYLYGIVSWERRQRIEMNIFGNYTSNDKEFMCKYSCSVASTVDRVPNVNTTISHLQNGTHFNTDITLMYNPDFVIGLESRWKIDEDNIYTNITGTVRSQSPFKGFKSGLLVSKIIIKDSNYIRGAAQLDLDHNQIDLDMEGKFIRLSDCMLVINATTIKDNYQLRFIISSAKRNFVSLITYPAGGLGGEILLSVNSITDFDVKLHLATPVEFLQDVIIVAKLKPHGADFRIGWNFLLLGFSGVWHYANAVDFDYSYKIYTPIEGFEENGIVAKLIFNEGLDFEFSSKFSYYKLGAKLLGQSKPKPLKVLGIMLKNVYERSKQSQTEEKDYDDPLSWEGSIELDVIIYPTIKGELEIDQRGTSYILKSELTTPHGMVEIFDQFEYTHTMTIRNSLEVLTPYSNFKTITSNFDLDIQTGQIYMFGVTFDYQNGTEMIKTGVYAKYIVETRDVGSRIAAQERTYNVTLKVNTPFEALPKLKLFGGLETQENYYNTKLLFTTNRSDISVDATIEVDNGRVDLFSRFHVTTPSIYIPFCELKVIKLFSPADNYIDVNLKVPEKFRTDISTRLTWMIRSRSDFRGMFQLATPFTGLENTTGGLEIYISDLRSTLQLMAQLNPIEVQMNAILSNNVFLANSELTFNGERIPLTVNCSIQNPSRNKREFEGILKLKDKQFQITGNADFMGALPARVSVKFTPEDNSPSVTFEYRISLTTLNRYELLGSIRYSNRFTSFNANLTTNDNRNHYVVDLKILTSKNDTFIVHATTDLSENKAKLNIDAETPITKLERPRLGATYEFDGLQRNIEGFFELTDAKGNVKINFISLYMENMLLRAIGRFENKKYTSQSSVEGFYVNPQKSFTQFKAGGDVKIDRLWEASTNITMILTPGNYKAVETHIKLPDENKETYSMWSNVDYKDDFTNIDYFIKYRTSYTQKKYGSTGKISTEDNQNLVGNIEVEWNGEKFNNFANLKRSEKTLDLIYKLKTPKYIDKQLLVANITYLYLDDHHLTCEAFFPDDRSVAFATVHYKELANMSGMLRITVPHKSLNNTGAYFSTESNAMVYNRYLKIFWDGDNALLDSKCDIKTGPTLLDRNTKGILIVELPLTTRHIAVIDYDYNEKPKTSFGQATLNYNGEKVLEGKYNRLSESQAGKDKDIVHVELQNSLMPVGADYIHKHDYGMPDDATRDNRVVHLYNLENRSKFNVSGELDVLTKWSGQEYMLTAIHSNRVVKFWTDYDVLNEGYKQHSRIELSPTNWIEYDVKILNKSLDEKFDAQNVVINVVYPRRSFTAQGFYNISDSIVSTDVSLVYDKDNKTVQAGMDWRRASLHREQLLFQIKHPSFEKNITFSSEYGYDKSSIDGLLFVEYSSDPNKMLALRGKLSDNSKSVTYNYTYNIWAKHIATNLNLDSRGIFYWNPNTFGTDHVTNYQRSYLPSSVSETLAKVSLENNEVEFKRDNIASGKSYFWGRYDGEYPVYTANMSAIYDTNDTKGEFYINFKKKLLYLNLNMTEDGSQSLHMYGVIPDARSAVFDIWRDYDDRRISDVAYYLRLNHSRLIMSSLKWRSDLIGDVTSGIRSNIKKFYEDTLEAINNTKQYVKSETVDAINGIWTDSKPFLTNFLGDLRNLTVIEEDLEELRVFLNKSYYANDFYIKDITDIVVSVFDDLALKSHLQSLPKIVQEIWSVMGDSGHKIKKSILWIIEQVKMYYKNATEFIHNLLNGDPIESLSIGLEKLVEKYDSFIKSLHVAIIQYMENMWSQMYTLVVEYWHKTLASIEPTFLKFIHYLESIAWNTGQKFIDFLYLRKNEIIESPYFLRLTKFSQDLDRFYKDITGNNTIASIYKYVQIAWNFIKEKYLTLIPFGKETMDVVNEILFELKQIGEIPSIKFLIDEWWKAVDYCKFYYDYLDMENRIHKIIRIVYIKLSEFSMTALETDNRQRVPKTKFIFEPNDGIMLLEQKLPMSWHAFNETPKFKEIPEIKKIFDIMSYLEETELSFWNLYYDYKPYTDPNDWLPPFKGHAMLVGNNHYVTFDKKFYDFRGNCTYLLATDFVDKNFTILVSYDDITRNNELIMLVGKTIVRINIFTDKVLVGESSIERLPLQIGETYLYKDAGIFKAESQLGFILECNMKFHTCIFEMSGWYFGKTAGLWGTYNNEPTDDFLTSNQTRAADSALKIFGNSWSLDKTCKNDILERVERNKTSSKEILALCEEFFKSKVSQLSTCFPRVPKESFLYMCLNSTTEQEACMSAVSYINLCSYANTPLRIPDTCIKCNLLNGIEIREGHFIRLQGSDVPQTADIVFIVEAKKCNKDLKKSKNFELLIDLVEKELQENKIINNSYAVVTFGGNGVYDEPRSLVIDGKTFTDAKSILKYFDQIPVGNGTNDMFNGIMFAYNLIFRPGVSRNFILVPCSECHRNNMQHDYSTIHQLLSESAISLHILMNNQFTMQKGRDAKIPFGIDRRFAYTKKDIKSLVGDQPLRKSINLPKSNLGLCLSLSLETNGTIYSAKLLEGEKKNARKLATVFAKTFARVATPTQCVDCECTAPNSGVSYMECTLCTMANSTRFNFETLGLDEDELNFFDGFSF